MTWTISYQIMMTASGPQEVAVGRYVPTPGFRQFSFHAGLTVAEGRATAFYF